MRCHLPVATVAPSPPAPDKIARSGKRQSTTDGELFLVDAISRYGFVILNKELHRVTMELRVLFSADKKKFSRNWWQISRCLQAAKNLTPTFAIYFANQAIQGYPVNWWKIAHIIAFIWPYNNHWEYLKADVNFRSMTKRELGFMTI